MPKKQQRKFTYTDVRDWKVVNNCGKVMPYHTKDKVTGKAVTITAFNGFRSAHEIARKLGGYAVRA